MLSILGLKLRLKCWWLLNAPSASCKKDPLMASHPITVSHFGVYKQIPCVIIPCLVKTPFIFYTLTNSSKKLTKKMVFLYICIQKHSRWYLKILSTQNLSTITQPDHSLPNFWACCHPEVHVPANYPFPAVLSRIVFHQSRVLKHCSQGCLSQWSTRESYRTTQTHCETKNKCSSLTLILP